MAWGRRPQAAALVAALADPGRGRDAIVIGEYERAFYGSQYAVMAPLFEHYGVQLWMPEAGGRVDYASEHDEKTMTMLGLSSKRPAPEGAIACQQVADPGDEAVWAVGVGTTLQELPAGYRSFQYLAAEPAQLVPFLGEGRPHGSSRSVSCPSRS